MRGNVLVINCGSSSIKFVVLQPDTGNVVAHGVAERLLSQNSNLKFFGEATPEQTLQLANNTDHHSAMLAIVDLIQQTQLDETMIAVGHRVVHGGEVFSESVLIDEEVLAAIAAHQHLAPLHNPANLQGIAAAKAAFPVIPHVAVFDTAFHQSMPETAYLYALPYELYSDHGVRRYGFHGSSHRYVTGEAANMLGRAAQDCNFISAHLGNGCSLCAVVAGKSVDTSMGFTPLEGLTMGTRSGDLDPSLTAFLEDHLGYTGQQVNTLYNKDSGLLGISGLSNDCRTLEQAAAKGNSRAQLALDIFGYRLAKYIASYTVAAYPLDALILTGGIGENSTYLRAKLLQLLHPLGYRLDAGANESCTSGAAGRIHQEDSPAVLVIPTNEEWVIASDAARIAGH
jgi:acetate kinase